MTGDVTAREYVPAASRLSGSGRTTCEANGVEVGDTDGLAVGLADGAGAPTPFDPPGNRL